MKEEEMFFLLYIKKMHVVTISKSIVLLTKSWILIRGVKMSSEVRNVNEPS